MQMHVLAAVALGGALGALARFLLVALVRAVFGDAFPAGTFAVNVLGCFLFGLCWSLHAGSWPRPVAAAVFAGFFSAFTTFSTFAYESLELWEQGRPLACAVNVLGQNVLGVAAVMSGLWLGRGD